jgi:hypothetical protein
MKIGYYTLENGSPDDICYPGDHVNADPLDSWALELAAEECAEYEWDKGDGWEWMENGATIVLVDEDGEELGRYDISVEYEPSFSATKKVNDEK